MKAILALTSVLLVMMLAACATDRRDAQPEMGRPKSLTGPIDTERLSQITRQLASEAFEGRAPGTAGETKTVAYLVEEFRRLGLEPGGENGSYVQTVPLIRTQVADDASFTVAAGGETIPLRFPSDIYVSTVRPVEQARIENAPMVFVGYGVHAPERGWDDYKDVDLTGKVAVFLVNDPDFEVAETDPLAGRFGGQAMTYYGRWAYKFEEAARRGAVAALVIHETEAAGYGWNVIESPGGENYNIILPEGARQPVLLQGWIQRHSAVDLLRRAGHDFETVKESARTPQFRPIELGRLSAQADITLDRITSRNVIAKLTGTTRPQETVMFAGHWDSFGVGPADEDGNRVRGGAVDDALGIAGVLEVARAFAAGPRPERTVVFAAWTAEERGLLGAEHYTANPLYPLETTVANFTFDVLQPVGPARDVILIGQGQSELEDRLARAAAEQERTVTPETHPENGLFYRADHFAFAKRGVPVLLFMALGGGSDLVEGGRAAGEAWLRDYTANCYHQLCDAWSADWDLRGAAQDVALAYAMGRELAFSEAWPGWKEGSEFQSVRQESTRQRR